jgi:hypothetical protein
VQALQVFKRPDLLHNLAMKKDMGELFRHSKSIEARRRMIGNVGINDQAEIFEMRLVSHKACDCRNSLKSRENV